jgi:hypothetical protein
MEARRHKSRLDKLDKVGHGVGRDIGIQLRLDDVAISISMVTIGFIYWISFVNCIWAAGAVRLDEIVAHGNDIVDESSAAVWDPSSRLVDVVLLAVRAAARSAVDVDVGAVHGCALDGQLAHVGRHHPDLSTMQGTSTQQSAGSLVIRPVFITLPPNLKGWLVSMASMMRRRFLVRSWVRSWRSSTRRAS